MRPITRITSPMVPLPRQDINTDDIIPAIYLKSTNRRGLAQGLFARWRYRPDGTPDPNFPLNDPRYQGAQILLTGANFGSGSSREHAVWALMEWGFRAILAPSFADIFHSNAVQNGLLPARITVETFEALLDWAKAHPSDAVTVDLEQQRVLLPDGQAFPFDIDAFARMRLLRGLDELDYLLEHIPEIEAFEARREGRAPRVEP
ncbi:MAG: 3-isopropylmalate dehydratase small subunit [Chloroflexi bacterium]|nr:3-isopropylmalate dehydratase small subunit [Chloroflexota bacterium]